MSDAKGLVLGAIPDGGKIACVSKFENFRVADHAAGDDSHIGGNIGSFKRPWAEFGGIGSAVFFFDEPKFDVDTVLFTELDEFLGALGVE